MFIVKDKSGKTLKFGSIITDFRGEKSVFQGVDTLPSPGKSGRINTSSGHFYPQVFDLAIYHEGSGVEVFSFGRWYPAVLLKINPKTFLVRYTTGSGCSRDKTFPHAKVRATP